MTFFAIVVSLLIDRFFLESDNYRRHNWFTGYSNWIARHTFAEKTFNSNLGLLLILTPLLLITAWLQSNFEGLIFSTAILLLCLGPIDLDRQVNLLIDADDRDDLDQRNTLAEQIIGRPIPEEPQEFSRLLAESILIQACGRLFGVIFWFLLLGPLGAVLYRFTMQLKAQNENTEASQRLLNILNWIPARLTALAYAIAGSFDDALHGWRQHYTLINQYGNDHSAPVLAGAGMGALRLDDSHQIELPSIGIAAESALNLVWRATLIWVGILGFAYLIKWIN
ncbi:MAG: regulatory signaling modulator protein AmpE [Chromatiales bacterium]|nr:regulatory signaling modulator protein AmpE [Chromatiales bacterium]